MLAYKDTNNRGENTYGKFAENSKGMCDFLNLAAREIVDLSRNGIQSFWHIVMFPCRQSFFSETVAMNISFSPRSSPTANPGRSPFISPFFPTIPNHDILAKDVKVKSEQKHCVNSTSRFSS